MRDDELSPNGVQAETGMPGIPALSCAELVRCLVRQPSASNLGDLKQRKRQDQQSQQALSSLQQQLAETVARLRELPEGSSPQLVHEVSLQLRQLQQSLRSRQHLGVREGIDVHDLSQAGWGIIVHRDEDPGVLEALAPLLSHRREQAGARFRIFDGDRAYRGPDRDSKAKFLVRNGASAAGPASPETVPYYLLVVGSPQRIPFEFQQHLDVQYAVGRLHSDRLEEYTRYAKSVVQAESHPPARPRRFTMVDVANPDDRATSLSSRLLVDPLHRLFSDTEPDWEVLRMNSGNAEKQSLLRLLGKDTPALLLTASHGMEFQSNSPLQLSGQGAILCQDWPGPRHLGPIPSEHYLAGTDIADDASLLGLVAFLFACYSAGTPEWDMFGREQTQTRRAPSSFVAALPKRLLSHPAGGALAVIGHIDRAWGYSFAWGSGAQRAQSAAIESTLRRLLRGHRVGYAVDFLNERYAELATMLSDTLEDMRNMRQADPRLLAELWTATQDARGYCVIGDPAVRVSSALSDMSTHSNGGEIHAGPDCR